MQAHIPCQLIYWAGICVPLTLWETASHRPQGYDSRLKKALLMAGGLGACKQAQHVPGHRAVCPGEPPSIPRPMTMVELETMIIEYRGSSRVEWVSRSTAL